MIDWTRWLRKPPSAAALSAFAALSLAGALALSAPAGLAAWQLQKRTDRLLLHGVSGTLWAGVSEAAFVRAQDRWYALENLRWEWLARHLLSGEIGVRLSFLHRQRRGEATLRLGPGASVLAKPARIDGVPIDYIEPLLPVPVDLKGELAVAVDELRWRAGALRAIDAAVDWRAAGVAAGKTDYRLGTLSAKLSMPEPGALSAELSDAGGPLELRGQLSHVDGRLKLDATLKPREQIALELRRALGLIGAPLSGEDGWRLNFSGAFKLPWLGGAAEADPASSEARAGGG